MEAIITQAIKNFGWSFDYARTVASEYERFMKLRSNDAGLSPSDDIDRFWHQHLLNTRNYAAFCAKQFGAFVHHDAVDADDQNARKARFYKTLAAYRLAYASDPSKRAEWRVRAVEEDRKREEAEKKKMESSLRGRVFGAAVDGIAVAPDFAPTAAASTHCSLPMCGGRRIGNSGKSNTSDRFGGGNGSGSGSSSGSNARKTVFENRATSQYVSRIYRNNPTTMYRDVASLRTRETPFGESLDKDMPISHKTTPIRKIVKVTQTFDVGDSDGKFEGKREKPSVPAQTLRVDVAPSSTVLDLKLYLAKRFDRRYRGTLGIAILSENGTELAISDDDRLSTLPDALSVNLEEVSHYGYC